MKEQTHDRGEKAAGSGLFRLYVGVGIFVVCYLLGAGPIAKLTDLGVLNESFVSYVYAPMFWLSKASPPVRRCLRWYVKDVWNVQPQIRVRL